MSPPMSPASSSPSTPNSSGSAVLTPSRKVQALLAQFSDSDSDEKSNSSKSVENRVNQNVRSVVSNHERSSNGNNHDDDDDNDDDNDDEVRPQGRLAKRLLGDAATLSHETASDRSSAGQTVPVNTNRSKRGVGNGTRGSADLESSNDDIATIETIDARPLYRREDGTTDKPRSSPARLRSASPLFFPSPSATNQNRSPLSSSRQNRDPKLPPSDQAGRSKFLILVEKHRKERIAREAAEIAKRAAGDMDNSKPPQRARGSSPADDSGESSASADEAAVKRIQKQAKPTRKASKKAMEEMNRETQRMSRNMQLAHQAKTRKKITKDSLLARFNFGGDSVVSNDSTLQAQNTPSSATVSDIEDRKTRFSTPPTSPIYDTDVPMCEIGEPQVKDITHLLSAGHVTEMHGALALNDQPLVPGETATDSLLSGKVQALFDYLQNDTTVTLSTSDKIAPFDNPFEKDHILDHATSRVTVKNQQPRINIARTSLACGNDSGSDDEIEIVKDRGLKRKYAAFETLPRRKAKEMPSHLALRSLAHLFGSDDKNRSVNAAELESNLRRKARMQALEERQQKIEELKARGIVIQTAEEREKDQQEVEDIVERARQEAAEIQKREKELAKKDGTYVKDNLDEDDDDSDDEDFEEEIESSQGSGSEDDVAEGDRDENSRSGFIADEVEEAATDEELNTDSETENVNQALDNMDTREIEFPRAARNARVIRDDEDDDGEDHEDKSELPKDDQSPQLPPPVKTPRSAPWSARKLIPGLQMSDDLPMGLSQAFAATMADSQTQGMMDTQEQDSLDLTADLPSPRFGPVAPLQRFDSVDLVSESQPSASQTQPLNVNLLSQSQVVPESPRGMGLRGTQYTPSQRQMPFDLTQDNGYMLSPFQGNRFAETPRLKAPHSTIETVVLHPEVEASPILQRRSRLQRGRIESEESDEDTTQPTTAFQMMQRAAKRKAVDEDFNKKKSEARKIVDEAAEESEDEYAGLGGASDDSGDDEENDEDRRMIDEDTQVGKGDEAKLAGLYADRERERDEKEVSKLLKDITTGALRRKRGVGDDLDLSDEEDAAARRREAKRRDFAKMRRELLKDEAVGKIAEDKRKEAFLRSIEDREMEDDEDDFDQPDSLEDPNGQSQSQNQEVLVANSQDDFRSIQKRKRPLREAMDVTLNQQPSTVRHAGHSHKRKPATLAQIRESVSFLIEEPDSQAAMVDLGLSDSENEPEAYVDLDRHFRDAEAHDDMLDEDNEDLGDFIVDDELSTKQEFHSDPFKKPELPRQERAPFTERRTKHTNVVDRLSLLRQASSASSTTSNNSTSSKVAFFSSKTETSFGGVPSLLRRATTSSSFGSMSGRETVSATGVVTNKTERGHAGEEKEFVRKGSGGRRNAVNYQSERKTLREEKMNARASIEARKGRKKHGFLGGLLAGGDWE